MLPVTIRASYQPGQLPTGKEWASDCRFHRPRPLPVTVPIADDFAAIRARLLDIQAAGRPATEPPAATHGRPPDSRPQYTDFYSWLMSGSPWSPG
jgi:hypothetical protein